MKKRITVRVPATTANLGPGFDCLGMALDLWNLIRVEVGEGEVTIYGEGAETLSQGPDNLVYRALAKPFEKANLPMPTLSLTCHNAIPLASGLGSSAAAIVGGLVAGNELCGRPLGQDQLLELASDWEGHPDNVAPALLGGCCIVAKDGGRLVTASVPVSEELMAVVFIPHVSIATEEARAILPSSVSHEDAAYNVARVALLIHALTTGKVENLRIATQDRLHQPPRQKLFPAMKNILRAALNAGALGVFLSGSGPSVMALARGREMTIGYEMKDAAEKSGVVGTVKITHVSEKGAHVVEGE